MYSICLVGEWFSSSPRLLLAQNKSGVEVRPEERVQHSGVTYDERTGTLNITVNPGMISSSLAAIKLTNVLAVNIGIYPETEFCLVLIMIHVFQGQRRVWTWQLRILGARQWYCVKLKLFTPVRPSPSQISMMLLREPATCESFLVSQYLLTLINNIVSCCMSTCFWMWGTHQAPVSYAQSVCFHSLFYCLLVDYVLYLVLGGNYCVNAGSQYLKGICIPFSRGQIIFASTSSLLVFPQFVSFIIGEDCHFMPTLKQTTYFTAACSGVKFGYCMYIYCRCGVWYWGEGNSWRYIGSGAGSSGLPVQCRLSRWTLLHRPHYC